MASAFHLYSLGVAAENLPLNSTELNVLPKETMSGFDGDLQVNPLEAKTKAKDSQGHQQEFSVKTDTVITAEWMPSEGNRITPPNVRRGETVEIWRIGDSDQFYWKSLHTQPGLRTLESSIHAWGANPKLDNSPRTSDNSYTFEVSTHKQLVTFKTSQKNGEPFGYTFQLNTKTGQFTIEDHTHNFIHLDSAKRDIHLKNSTGSEVYINDKDIKITAVRDLIVKVGRDLKTEVGKDETRTVKANRTTTINANDTESIKQSKTKTVGTAETVTVNGPYTATHSKVSTLNVGMLRSMTFGKALTVQGPAATLTIPTITQTGMYTAVVDVVGAGKSLKGHEHPNGGGGSPTGKPM